MGPKQKKLTDHIYNLSGGVLNGSQTWSLTLRTHNGFRIFKNTALRIHLGAKRGGL
jgi:hypothetical protein